MEIYLRQEWYDPRLADDRLGNDSVILNHKQYGQLWVPDLYFPNEKRAMLHDITVPNRLLILKPGGSIFYSQRYECIIVARINSDWSIVSTSMFTYIIIVKGYWCCTGEYCVR